MLHVDVRIAPTKLSGRLLRFNAYLYNNSLPQLLQVHSLSDMLTKAEGD